MPRSAYTRTVAVLLAVGTLGGCGTVAERRDDVRDTTAVFEKALTEGAYDRVCAVLAPATVDELEQSAGSPCAQAVSEESLKPGGSVRRTDVYGNQARAVLATDTLFLSHFTSGWKVVAAGCEPRPKVPYQFRIKGG
ncbi:hypothetical protein ACKI1I_01810 [Streptomyces turgidiscabies]|uniref:Putative lipoprotein n=1 Tax=Streptomyces turgidiscabies (strain Car8) TaxID=698760 RepID=L7F6Q1_STRT8|nr:MULTISPECIES: hypothetical protein [Streptomyces]ELP66957.1 putative lipoprotein [Streptomyces turgidiscabies Car8]MDX3492366.1 hypothetical protein [Streptomyces turgidiscabies]GAQ69339.1 hypothetical protein T45_01063 [Streptomyces turgidiscabies]